MYPRINNLVAKPQIKQVKKSEIGKPMTIPNQAMTLKDIVQRTVKGFPVPMARQELKLHPDLNQVLQGTNMDIVSDSKFAKMSKTQRQQYLNNLNGLKQQLSEKVQNAITKKQEKQAEIELQQQQAPTEPTAP